LRQATYLSLRLVPSTCIELSSSLCSRRGILDVDLRDGDVKLREDFGLFRNPERKLVHEDEHPNNM
jgi:hypothetical protein